VEIAPYSFDLDEKEFALRVLKISGVLAILFSSPGLALAEEAAARDVTALLREIAELRAELERGQERLDALEARARELAAPETPEEVAKTPPSAPQPTWEVGYREGGGGFFLRSPEGDLQMRMLGYAQVTAAAFHGDFERADEPGDFGIRRARLDWLIDFYDRYQFFVEIDGGPGSTPGSSDFALVEAKLTTDLVKSGKLQLIAGKYVSPFSTENLLSSRSLDTVERYVALNSMFLLPALDVQFGATLRGYAWDDRLEWYAGVFNGNGRANDNISDDNDSKEYQLKFNLWPDEHWKLGLGFDASEEEPQSLQLRGLSFTPWVAVPIEGERRGWTADFKWEDGRLHFRGEGLYFDFDDAEASLGGGFVQAGYFLDGDSSDGLQLLVRAETARISSSAVDLEGDRIDAITLGLNYFYLGNFRVQLDGVFEHYNGASNLPAGTSRVEGDGWKPYLLTQLQIKF